MYVQILLYRFGCPEVGKLSCLAMLLSQEQVVVGL